MRAKRVRALRTSDNVKPGRKQGGNVTDMSAHKILPDQPTFGEIIAKRMAEQRLKAEERRALLNGESADVSQEELMRVVKLYGEGAAVITTAGGPVAVSKADLEVLRNEALKDKQVFDHEPTEQEIIIDEINKLKGPFFSPDEKVHGDDSTMTDQDGNIVEPTPGNISTPESRERARKDEKNRKVREQRARAKANHLRG